jgi:hypothetical protein
MIRRFGAPTLEFSTIEPMAIWLPGLVVESFHPSAQIVIVLKSSTRPVNYFSQVSVLLCSQAAGSQLSLASLARGYSLDSRTVCLTSSQLK